MQDKLFSEVRTLGEAEDILRDAGIDWMGTFQFTYPERHPAHMLKNKGIHIYFQDSDRNDIAYYTAHMESLMIFAEPRIVDAGFNTMGEFKLNHRRQSHV